MPRKTPAERARNSTRHFKQKIAEAYTKDEIDAPLTESMRWLYAALAQRARENPENAHELYKHATDSLAAFAEQIQSRIITETATGKAN